MKKYRFLSLVLLLTAILSLFPASASDQEDLDLFCTNAVLLDANHGEVLYNMKANERAYPASITKVMTALLVMEAIEYGQLSPSDVVTVSQTAVEQIPPACCWNRTATPATSLPKRWTAPFRTSWPT